MIKYESGQRYGYLVLVKIHKKANNNIWECLCDCGNTTYVSTSHLGNGHTTSCGCYRDKTRKVHNESRTRLHRIWLLMRSRCGEKSHCKKYYSDRGIKVCQEWNNYISFRNWAIENGYDNELTIDRINNNDGYNPNNCRWVKRCEQSRNLRRNIYLQYGKYKMLLVEYANILGITYNTAYGRYKKCNSFDYIFRDISKEKINTLLIEAEKNKPNKETP